jgi:hypothetical protein
MTFRDGRLLCAAAVTTVAVRAGLWVLPFRVVRAAAGRLASARVVPSKRHSRERLVWATMVATRFVPRATCLTQSLTAQILLRRHGYPAELRLGVAREAGQFAAHAWVESDGHIVIGNADVWRYTSIAAIPIAANLSRREARSENRPS